MPQSSHRPPKYPPFDVSAPESPDTSPTAQSRPPPSRFQPPWCPERSQRPSQAPTFEYPRQSCQTRRTRRRAASLSSPASLVPRTQPRASPDTLEPPSLVPFPLRCLQPFPAPPLVSQAPRIPDLGINSPPFASFAFGTPPLLPASSRRPALLF